MPPAYIQEPPASPGTAGEVYVFPASFAQARLWFLHQYAPTSPVYNLVETFRLSGVLEVAALERALQTMVARHETLRTTFALADTGVVQRIAASGVFHLPIVDLTELPDAERQSRARQLLEEESRKPFDLARGPLLRGLLIRLQPAEHMLLLVFHHVISDGASLEVFWTELAAIYTSLVLGLEPRLAELPIQYADFAVWQREQLQGDALESTAAYWRGKLAEAPPFLDLPTDLPRPSTETFHGDICIRQLGPSLTASLKALAKREHVTLFMLLLAAFKVLLYRYSGQSDLLVGTPIAGRNREEVEPVIGFFVNMLVLRSAFSDNPAFVDLLRRVKETALEAYTHQDLPLERLIELLKLSRDTSRHPLFQVVFQWRGPAAREPAWHGLRAESILVHNGTAMFDLYLEIKETNDRLVCTLEFNSDLFESATISRMLANFEVLLEGIIASPGATVTQLPLLTPAEQQLVQVEWNRTASDYPRDQCVHQLFEAQASRAPEAVALVLNGQSMTYGELNRRADRLAACLVAAGAVPASRVGICVGRSFEEIVAMLAVLKAGCAYVPLDPDYPAERLRFLIRDSAIQLLLSTRSLASEIAPIQCRLIDLDQPLEPTLAPLASATASADQVAYVMYTSGSTGDPKGVRVTHRGIVRLVRGARYAAFSADEVFAHLAPFTFDAATFEIWGALLNGARLVLLPSDTLSLRTIGAAIREQGITALWLTAGLFHAMVDECLEDLRPLHQLLAGGDVLSPAHVRRALASLPGTRLINGYGPTENTTFTCCHPITAETSARPSVPIGPPVANTRVYILDESRQPVPIGVRGELYAGGDGVALGYLNRPELTAEKFVPDPFSSDPSARLYRTGDRARWLPDGNIEFCGRQDFQVKIRGYRVELAEIESVLGRHPQVRQCAVVARQAGGDQRLLAFVVPAAGPQPSPQDLRAFLRKQLPQYMVPSVVTLLAQLPATPHGKVDRKALPEPAAERPTLAEPNPSDSALAIQVRSLWAELLRLPSVQWDDNFFELGGHSLLAATLAARLEKIVGRPVPVRLLFQAPTVRELVEALVVRGWRPRYQSLVPVQSKGSLPPLFCFHGVGGEVFIFLDLARELAPDQPVYGLVAPLGAPETPMAGTVEELAALYVKEIETFQPTGPCLLAGYSGGGVIAYETARQLQACGRSIALLGLFESYLPNPLSVVPVGLFCHSSWVYVKNRSRYHWTKMRKLRGRQVAQYLKDRCFYFPYQLSQLSRGLLDRLGLHKAPAIAAPLIPTSDYYGQIAMSYRPKPFAGRVTLFLGEQDIRLAAEEWGCLASGGVQVHRVSGDHYDLLSAKHAKELAQVLRSCLKQALTPTQNPDGPLSGTRGEEK